MNLKKSILPFGLLVIAGIAAFVFYSSRPVAEGPTELMKVRISIPKLVFSSPYYYGKISGIFEKHGLDVEIIETETGTDGLFNLENGRADYAYLAETPFVALLGTYDNLRWFVSNSSSESFLSFGKLPQSGINDITDLVGKKVGIPYFTIGHYYLARALAVRGIDPKEVEFIDVAPSQFASAMASGEVDAVTFVEPTISLALKELTEKGTANVVSISPVETPALSSGLVSTQEYLESHRQISKALIEALFESTSVISNHPDVVANAVASHWQIEPAQAKKVFEDSNFGVFLKQSIFLSLEEQADYLKRSGKIDFEIPNFLKYIYTDSLEEVAPENMTIIK